MAKTKRTTFVLVIILLLIMQNSMMASANSQNLLPFEDEQTGRNSNAYLPLYEITSAMKTSFIDEIAGYAKEANAKWGIPTSAIIGMAIVESGYGTTRIAVNANNLFGIKIWVTNSAQKWQLKGQPDEHNGTVPVLADYGKDRIVYDETERVDNWYRMFDSRKEAVNYLAGTLLLNERYGFAKTNYENNLKKGWSYERASKQYIYDIANAGYNHLGGEYYRNIIGNVMTEWDLYKYDEKKFKDIQGHWAQKEIVFLAENGWISGYTNKTFKPDHNLTRAQAAQIISNFLELDPTAESIRFDDVPNDYWALDPIASVAQHKLMNGTTGESFSPKTNLTRAQMAQIFYNAGFYNESAPQNAGSFTDVEKDHWAYPAIETMKQEGILAGYANGRFGVNDSITRAQMAAVIYRLDEKGWKGTNTDNFQEGQIAN